MLLNILKDVNT